MTTYNTYQEAKIANPECEIYQLERNGLFAHCNYHKSESVRFVEFDSDGVKCNPADHCMTVEKFLADGCKGVAGDWFMIGNGNAERLSNVGAHSFNIPSPQDFNVFILRAAALEEKKPRTKVEYVKVTDSIFDLRPDFEAGELYFRWLGNSEQGSGGVGYDKITTESMLLCRYEEGRLLRRIETPMTEREAFVEAAIHELESGMSDRDYAKALFDSGKFKLVN